VSRRTKLHFWCTAALAVTAAAVLAGAPRTHRTVISASVTQDLGIDVAVHDVGTLHLTVSNWGMIGSWPNTGMPFEALPSAQWQGGSRVEYLFGGGLWVGALADSNTFPSVSTGFTELEFRPTPDPIDVIYAATEGMPGGERYPSLDADDDGDGLVDEEWHDSRDNDGDGQTDEDIEAVSAQMFSRWYTDDQLDAGTIYPQHDPLHLTVRERSIQWREIDYDDLVGFEFEIRNTGTRVLNDVYVGFWHDLDAGNRDADNYYDDDQVAMATIQVDHGARGVRDYDYVYVYDSDGDGGNTPGAFGMLLLDHTTDAAGVSAPTDVRLQTFVAVNPGHWAPNDDYTRYETMASGSISPPTVVPRDYSAIVSVGPFPRIGPGESVSLAMAMVATLNDGTFANVINAALLYHGEWFDIDGEPSTGIDGKEHQVHWFVPGDLPMHFEALDATVSGGNVDLAWRVTEGARPIAGFRIQRRHTGGEWENVLDGYLPSDARTFADTRADRGRTYEYVVRGADTRGWEVRSPYAGATIPVTSTELRQNHPNPFNPATVIPFTLTKRQNVSLVVYDAGGRRVATLVNGTVDAGLSEYVWEGVNDRGDPVASGVYFCRLVAEGVEQARKMVLVK